MIFIKLQKKKNTYLHKSVTKNKTFIVNDSITNKTILYYDSKILINNKYSIDLNKTYTLSISEPTENKKIIFCQRKQISILNLKDNSISISNTLPFRIQDACYFKEDIFLGTLNGLYLLKKNKKIIDYSKKNNLFKVRIEDIDYNKYRKEFYFGTIGNGIIVYNITLDSVYNISKQNGLYSNNINEIYIENKNNIWVCTNSGLNKIEFKNKTYSIKGIKNSNGLLSDGVNDVKILNDTLYIATNKGLVYTPKSVVNSIQNLNKTILKLKNIKLNETPINLNKLKNLKHNENSLEFTFEAISFKNEGEISYKYILEGVDENWFETTNRKIRYSSLTPGKYLFKIKTKNLKSNYISFPIIINPPFWKTIWFIMIVCFLSFILIYLFFKIRILTYNKDVVRELLRIILKKINKEEKYFIFKELGKEKRILSNTILYVKSSGNYIDIITENKRHSIRCKISNFIELTPDPLEYLRVHRSYIVRIDKITEKSKSEIIIKDEKIPVSNKFLDNVNQILWQIQK